MTGFGVTANLLVESNVHAIWVEPAVRNIVGSNGRHTCSHINGRHTCSHINGRHTCSHINSQTLYRCIEGVYMLPRSKKGHMSSFFLKCLLRNVVMMLSMIEKMMLPPWNVNLFAQKQPHQVKQMESYQDIFRFWRRF
ncbi:hypothetical protein MKW98_016546 [Papaver atlanticum]|uniref:Uncharacterized protein n=1 Tax=Papaver atlanticum TaxID=357466 RepID=A0AAD4RZ81_9MAGN|nr:hypothetical protein MKW98_016546 [Papaver atlanticum]